MIIGVQGIQGSGKSTLVETLCEHHRCFERISIDDFYLEQGHIDDLHRAHGSAYEFRGNPGTHDIDLLLATLHHFRTRRTCSVPVYDKRANGGLGQRSGFRSLDPTHKDALFVEGWCIGFEPIGTSTFLDGQIERYRKLHEHFDAMVVLRPPRTEIVHEWRAEAEAAARKAGGGMDPAQLRRFVDMYVPTYDAYLPGLYARPPVTPTLVLSLDDRRYPRKSVYLDGPSSSSSHSGSSSRPLHSAQVRELLRTCEDAMRRRSRGS